MKWALAFATARVLAEKMEFLEVPITLFYHNHSQEIIKSLFAPIIITLGYFIHYKIKNNKKMQIVNLILKHFPLK